MVELLFSKQDLSGVLDNRQHQIKREVGGLSEERLLNTMINSLLDYFNEKYRLNMPEINEAAIYTDWDETLIDVSGRFEYASSRLGRPQHVAGTKYKFNVPFEGDPDLFRYRPSPYDFSPPRATILEDRLVFEYGVLPNDISGLKPQFDRDLSALKRHLGWASAQVEGFNTRIPGISERAIGARRSALTDAQEVARGLGFPVRRRRDAPSTYVAPEVRRRVAPKLPPITPDQATPVPVLDAAEYENILSIISSMVIVMERSPSAFRTMKEEELRQHFLVQLNAQYEGQATAETFNSTGKTDILIRVDGKNIFIAECKLWRGPADLNSAIDQLLGYTTWRDTKTALLVFNRDTRMSTVLKRIPEVIEQHPNYKTTHNYDSETGFQYILSHRDDPERELTLTVLVFHVPGSD